MDSGERIVATTRRYQSAIRNVTAITNKVQSFLLLTVLWVFSQSAVAQMLDMRPGVTDMSQRIQQLHHLILWICVVVGAVVFGVMFYSIIAHRRSKHPVPATFHESTAVEIVWTLIPTLILVGIAVPATMTLWRHR